MLKYKNFKLIQPDINQITRINELIGLKNGSIFHDFSLNKIVAGTFKTQLYYLVDNPLKIENFAPVHISKNKYGLKRYHFKPLYDIPYAGFIENEVFEADKISLSFFESIEYKGFPYNKKIHPNLNGIRIGETAMIDLSMQEDEIFSTIIHSKRRNMIRKANKSNIEIRKFNDSHGLSLFWPILEQLHIKLGYSRLTFDYYYKIFEYYRKLDQAFILIAFKEEIPISGIFLLGNKNYMHYYKGATLTGIKNEGQGELLQWEAIKLSKTLGVKQYDLCNLDQEKLPEIYKFKTGISNNMYQYLKFTKNNMGYKIINALV